MTEKVIIITDFCRRQCVVLLQNTDVNLVIFIGKLSLNFLSLY